MERYAEYKESHIEWVGLIPVHWDIIRVRFLCNIVTGDKDTVNRIDDGEYPFYVRSPIVERIDTYSFDGEAVLTAGDGVGAGKVFHHVTGKFDYHQRVYNLHNFRRVSGKYLFFFMQENFYKEIERSNAKSTVDSIRLPMIQNFAIAFPSTVKEQNHVVDYIDCRTAEIDAVIADLQTKTAMLERYKRQLIADTVMGGIDKTVPRKDGGVDWIGEIPKDWTVTLLRGVAKDNTVKNEGMKCDNLLSLSYGRIIQKDIGTHFGLLPASFEGYQIVHEGYTVLRLTDLQNDKRNLRTGYVGETGIITSAYTALVPSDEIDSRYFQLLLHVYDLKKIFYGLGGGVRQSLKYTDLRALPVLIPPMPVQKAIVQFVDNKISQVDGLIADINQQIENLKKYRQIVIHDAVTGKVKVAEGYNDNIERA